MADPTVSTMEQPPLLTADFDNGLSIPPFDTAFLSSDFDGGPGHDQTDFDDFDFDLDFSLEDLGLPSSEDIRFDSQPDFPQFDPNFDQFAEEFNGSEVLYSASPVMESHQIPGSINILSPESNGSNHESLKNGCDDVKGVNSPLFESQGSGNCGGSNVSEDLQNNSAKSVSSSPNSVKSSIKVGVVDQKVNLDGSVSDSYKVRTSLLKRKKVDENSVVTNTNTKLRKSNGKVETLDSGLSEEDEKKKARLVRNRESAQLSRQRKKQYVDELEDKLKNMQSIVQDLNVKISYFMAENATLKQQMGAGGGAGVVPAPMVPPPPGMYPHPAMMYPWMPCGPQYMMAQGSQVPLVPIPRLKPRQPAQAPKVTNKVDSKKNERPKTKKVASVTFLGLLFFIMLFGGLLPMVNVRYGGVREAFTGGKSYVGRESYYEKHNGRVLMVNGTECGEKYGCIKEPSTNEFACLSNGSEPLVASLYVPRNDKLVKIDGNLIIHSVLATEKSMASHGKESGETSLAVPGHLPPPVGGVGSNGVRHPSLYALGSGSEHEDNLKPTLSTGKVQQWFREGLTGPLLSSAMCTEVFQFDVSAAIVPATKNMTKKQNHNSTHLNKGMNRRILRGLPIPLPESSLNMSGEHIGINSQKGKLNGNNNVSSSMVVSVLVDPREASDADVNGVLGTKSLSRIFVVVLVDSVKYVTYSCMLPFLGSTPHAVTN